MTSGRSVLDPILRSNQRIVRPGPALRLRVPHVELEVLVVGVARCHGPARVPREAWPKTISRVLAAALSQPPTERVGGGQLSGRLRFLLNEQHVSCHLIHTKQDTNARLLTRL